MNLTDPRNLKRARKALGFCYAMLRNEPIQLSKKQIDKAFGQQQNPTSKYLREQLLHCHDEFFRFNSDESKCKEYKWGKGKALVEQQVFGKTPITQKVKIELIHIWFEDEFKDELESGQFNYSDKADRLFHPIQNIKRELKNEIMSEYGYKYDYDIKAAAPTLIYQYSKSFNIDLICPLIESFLSNPNELRQHIADVCGKPDLKIAKKIITALFTGAQLKAHKTYSDIYKMIGYDFHAMKSLQNDSLVTQLRNEIKLCWSEIKKSNDVSSPKKKAAIYRQLERQVLEVIRKELNRTNNNHLSEHDGFKSQQVVDTIAMQDLIRQKSGFRVILEDKVLGSMSGHANTSVLVSSQSLTNVRSCSDTNKKSPTKKIKGILFKVITHNTQVTLLYYKSELRVIRRQ